MNERFYLSLNDFSIDDHIRISSLVRSACPDLEIIESNPPAEEAMDLQATAQIAGIVSAACALIGLYWKSRERPKGNINPNPPNLNSTNQLSDDIVDLIRTAIKSSDSESIILKQETTRYCLRIHKQGTSIMVNGRKLEK